VSFEGHMSVTDFWWSSCAIKVAYHFMTCMHLFPVPQFSFFSTLSLALSKQTVMIWQGLRFHVVLKIWYGWWWCAVS